MGEKAMSFLNNKSFHPGNAANRYKLFEAEEKKKKEDRLKEELAKQFAQEESRRALGGIMKERRGGPAEAPMEMGFMYNKPPGMVEAQTRTEQRPGERDAERFPILKDAPRQGNYTMDIEASHPCCANFDGSTHPPDL